ncbi:ion transporter [Paradesertivirga mongoliensis]|uniref:Ion transporter n=1 Tax=Paradesertivirga mongoliensis TaxID=2100740 RepID=A0ABW4ZMG6_9SPHI|nr:potassium channel family protein [Pedobacter mongoliensis]
MKQTGNPALKRNRQLIWLEKVLEGPMIFLGFVWLVLLIIELIYGVHPVPELISTAIWIVFILDFALKLILAPRKLLFIKKNVLTAISLVIPALRLFRIFRFIRLLRIFRGTRLIKVIASLNRSMKSLNATMQRRGFAYVMALTLAVIFAGAAGMYAFEKDNGGLSSYAVSLWWTTMLIMTVGTDFWPQTAEGRILCTLLSLYGFAVFGYITATLASFFVGKDAMENDIARVSSKDLEEIKSEIKELRNLLPQILIDPKNKSDNAGN